MDPVVLKGSDLPELAGLSVSQIVGFNFDANGQWNQIPIQIDEMHYQSWATIKHADRSLTSCFQIK